MKLAYWLIASSMLLGITRGIMKYKVVSLSIYGGEEVYYFDTKLAAQQKVRELKDPDHFSAFIVKTYEISLNQTHVEDKRWKSLSCLRKQIHKG